MDILAIDPATQCGWALKRNGKIKSGSKSFKSDEHQGGGFAYIDFLQFLLSLGKFDVVVYESVHAHSGATASHKYGAWLAIIKMYCSNDNTPYKGWPPTVIKKHWTGKGNAKKEMMIQEAFNRDFNPVDDNEADALAILSLAEDQFKDIIDANFDSLTI